MKKIVLLTVVGLCFLLSIYIVQNYSNSVIENYTSFRINNPSNLISFVKTSPLTIKQGDCYDTALNVTNLLDVYMSYRLECLNPAFSISPAESILFPGQSEVISITANDSGCVGPLSLDVYLYADFSGGTASLKTALLVNVEGE